MAKRFVWATDADGKGRYINIDAVAIAAPSREGNGYLLKSAGGKVLGVATAECFRIDDYED